MTLTAHKRTPFGRLRLLLLALTFVIVFALLRALNRPEPELAGFPLSHWMERMSDPATAANAAHILSDIGPESVPALVEGLQTHPSELSDFMHAAAYRVNLAPPRIYDAANVRATAAYLLGQLGSNAVPAVPDLLVALDDEDSFVRLRARRALTQIRKEAPPQLASQIKRALVINGK
jgi:HEAT repeat protein